MKRKMLLRLAALPFVLALGGAPALAGCDVVGDAACPEWEADYGASLSSEVSADVRAFMLAAGQLSDLADETVVKLSTACANIAVAAGRDKSAWEGKEGGPLVTAACNEADAGIKAALAAAGDISVEFLVTGGECHASIEATSECYAKCDVSGGCTPAQLEAKCEPGKLAGKCAGECSGSCDVQGGSVECVGECSATCTGTCQGDCIGRCNGEDSTGQCAGTCEGKCTSECNGTCSGTCTYTEPSASCKGTCHGECSVDFEAPRCEGKFTGPECDIDAECQANCEASIQAEAECTPPKVEFNIIGSASGGNILQVAEAIEANLPEILLFAAERAEVLQDIAGRLVTSGENIASNTAELTTKAVACMVPAVEAAASASVKIEASVSVSAKVSGTASGSASAN